MVSGFAATTLALASMFPARAHPSWGTTFYEDPVIHALRSMPLIHESASVPCWAAHFTLKLCREENLCNLFALVLDLLARSAAIIALTKRSKRELCW
jgi:hypothetical protein